MCKNKDKAIEDILRITATLYAVKLITDNYGALKITLEGTCVIRV